MYGPGNEIQQLVITCNGIDSEKKYTYKYIHTHIHIHIIYMYTLYIHMNHFGINQKLTQYCKSTILQ